MNVVVSAQLYKGLICMKSEGFSFAAFFAGDFQGAYRHHANLVIWFLTAFAIYAFAAHHQPMANKHYVYLADAFLHGSLSMINFPADLIEVIRFKGGNYLAYGIAPAILLMPFVALFGTSLNPAYIVIGIGALNVAIMCRLLQRLQFNREIVLWVTVLFAFGTVHFHAATWGTTWFYMQITAVFFLLLAMLEISGKNRGFLVGLAFGAAVLSRNPVLLSAPFFLIMMNRSQWSWQRTIAFGSALGLCLGFNGVYNYARFGNLFENGYKSPYNTPYGMFSWRYVTKNLYTYFLSLPEWIGDFPYIRPSLNGTSLFITTPAFLFIFRATHRDLLTLSSWLGVFGVLGLYLGYFWAGYAQFGVRYILDFSPFLMILTATGLRKVQLMRGISLIFFSILINLWGIAWWRFGNIITP